MELAWHLVKGGHADTIRASDGERIDGRQAAPFAAEVQGRQFIRIVAYCFVALCPASSSSARRINGTASGIEENFETRCSFVHRRSPASAKAGDRIKSRRAIVRNQVQASTI
jgi:hypothetical protein